MITITIVNDKSGNQNIASYDYEVYVNRDCVAKGRVEDFFRSQGWIGLVELMCKIEAQKDAREMIAKVMSPALENFLKTYCHRIVETDGRE